jgi:beta-lactamase regulating signal transducer with metallopeptidase domain
MSAGSSMTAAVFVLVGAAFRSGVLILIAAVVLRFWRRASAATRHTVWFASLTASLLMPFLSAALPAWPASWWTVKRSGDSGRSVRSSEPRLPNFSSQMPAPIRQVLDLSTISNSPSAPATSAARGAFGNRVAPCALAVWLAGVVAGFVGVVRSACRLRQVELRAHTEDAKEWSTLLRKLQEELGVGRCVRLLRCSSGSMPVTWGWRRPAILLPFVADTWDEDRRRVVLLHELAHIRRGDCLTQLVARIACVLLWFNPLVWVAAQRMRVEREHACDDSVLEARCEPSEYAGHLVEIAFASRPFPIATAIAVARSSALERRVAAILDSRRSRRRLRGASVLAATVTGAALVSVVAAQHPEPSAAASGGDEFGALVSGAIHNLAQSPSYSWETTAVSSGEPMPTAWRGKLESPDCRWVCVAQYGESAEFLARGGRSAVRLHGTWFADSEADKPAVHNFSSTESAAGALTLGGVGASSTTMAYMTADIHLARVARSMLPPATEAGELARCVRSWIQTGDMLVGVLDGRTAGNLLAGPAESKRDPQLPHPAGGGFTSAELAAAQATLTLWIRNNRLVEFQTAASVTRNAGAAGKFVVGWTNTTKVSAVGATRVDVPPEAARVLEQTSARGPNRTQGQ